MSLPYSRAPHAVGAPGTPSEALNAALLIDFDNVTMGMRSDLSKELKNLLNSDIIKGKVTVQRAYADWRRYPQYIVPLSENSVDLIFAPAYGSSKKNATDIRMAIDAIELVFIRPEIGTFILLTGDSDFSSLVLKLKEYGKYVIGVGIQESSSDILVQNCDEYYSYTSLTGLKKTTDTENKPADPWVLVGQAVGKMAGRDDVMRSDRLKQVMMEIDPTFDEGNFGFSKFSRFLSEASSRDLVKIRKLENGQYEVVPSGASSGTGKGPSGEEPRKAAGRGRPRGKEKEDRGRGRPSGKAEARGDGKKEARPGDDKAVEAKPEAQSPELGGTASEGEDPLQTAYGLLRQALGSLRAGEAGGVRDSDLKRKMLRLEPSFDENALGFGKFSRFLRQAHDHEIVDLEKRPEGTYQVSMRAPGAGDVGAEKGPAEIPAQEPAQSVVEQAPAAQTGPVGGSPAGPPGGLGLRRGSSRGRKDSEGPPPLFEGQAVGGEPKLAAPSDRPEAPSDPEDGAPGPSKSRTPRGRRGQARSKPTEGSLPPQGRNTGPFDAGALGLPADGPAIVRYLTNSYKGVGQKTAETLVREFGSGIFQVLHESPRRLSSVIAAGRAEQLLKGWKIDLDRRLGRSAEGPGEEKKAEPEKAPPSRRRTRKGTRGRPRGDSGRNGPS